MYLGFLVILVCFICCLSLLVRTALQLHSNAIHKYNAGAAVSVLLLIIEVVISQLLKVVLEDKGANEVTRLTFETPEIHHKFIFVVSETSRTELIIFRKRHF